MVLQRKTQGWWLWARFHRLPHDIVIAVVSTLALRMAILLTLESNGGTIEIEPLWLSFIASLPLVFIFSHEAKPDLCAPRSLIRRRLILLTSAGITGAIVSIAVIPLISRILDLLPYFEISLVFSHSDCLGANF